MKTFLYLIIASILLLPSCDSTSQKQKKKSKKRFTPKNEYASIDHAVEHSLEHIMQANNYIYLHDLKLEEQEPKLLKSNKKKDINALLNIYLMNGEFDLLLSMLEEKKDMIGKSSYVKFKAFGLLRLAEQSNCISNRNSSSCLFPITEQGIYSIPEFSLELKMLIEQYYDSINNINLQQRLLWVYNIACMSLGNYPENAREDLLIDQEKLSSEKSSIKLSDKAQSLNIDDNRLAGGVVIDDFNNNGNMDIVVSSMDPRHPIFIYEYSNNTFVNKTKEWKLNNSYGGLNMIHFDYNNDGFLDLFVLRGAWGGSSGVIPNSLYKNVQGKYFEDVTIKAGLLEFAPTITAHAVDVNNDGFLDLFVGNESPNNVLFPSNLFLNHKGEGFSKVNHESIASISGTVKGIASTDLNNDMYPEIFISVQNGSNYLLINQSNKTTVKFVDQAEKYGVTLPNKSFATWFFDYDNDGLTDLFVSPFYMKGQFADLVSYYQGGETESQYEIHLFKNQGDHFENVASEVNLDEVSMTMGANYGDLNNDGYFELYLGTGAPSLAAIFPNLLYEYDQKKGFKNVTHTVNIGHIQKGHAICFQDIDNDGDKDLYAVMGGNFLSDNFYNACYINTSEVGNYVKLQFNGSETNSFGSGVSFTVFMDSDTLYRQVSTGGSFGSNSYQQHVGLGKSEVIDKLTVNWPVSNKTSIYKNLSVNKEYVIREDDDQLSD